MSGIDTITGLLGRDGLRFAEAQRAGALTVVPVFHEGETAAYRLFAGVPGSGAVAVGEAGGGSVPDLPVANRSYQAVLLVEGEALSGLRRTRTLNATVAEGPSPWFRRLPAPGPGEPGSDEARRLRERAETREFLLRLMRGQEGEGRCPPPDPGVAPGFWSPAPVLGFRFWYVSSGCLRGVRQIWPRPELEARCAVRGPGAPHTGGGCRCGIYALKAPEGLPRPGSAKMRPGAGLAYGLVALSGVVVEHEHGYRAARAEAAAMAVLFDGRAVCGADRSWMERLFARSGDAIEEAERGAWRQVRAMVPSAAEAVRFLRDEASRLEGAWTSASRRG